MKSYFSDEQILLGASDEQQFATFLLRDEVFQMRASTFGSEQNPIFGLNLEIYEFLAPYDHTSYLSILVHRRIIEVYKKYTKKLS